MADQITQDEDGRTYKNGVLQVSTVPSASPVDALHAMIAALARAFAPPQLTHRATRINQAVDEASGAPQTSQLGEAME
jgi:hypothetical protein